MKVASVVVAYKAALSRTEKAAEVEDGAQLADEPFWSRLLDLVAGFYGNLLLGPWLGSPSLALLVLGLSLLGLPPLFTQALPQGGGGLSVW